MSGLIFVLDAEGRPLMLMSAAYARTLIKQGKAQVWPNPAFSVIQLTRVVEMPILRPVLVGISLTSTIADLVITVDQQRSRPSTIHIVVDFQSLPLLRRMHPNRLVPHRRSIPFIQIGSLPQPADHVRMLMAVLRACHDVIPISHLVLLPSARRTALTPPHAWWIEHRLAERAGRLSRPIKIVHQHTRLSGESPRTLTRHLIEQMIWAAREFPQLVACAPTQHAGLHICAHQYHRWKKRPRPMLEGFLDSHLNSIGRLCTVRHQRRTITGIVRALEPPDQLVLQVPVQVDDYQGVQWRSIYVRITPSLHVWPSTSIWLLPIARKSDGTNLQQ